MSDWEGFLSRAERRELRDILIRNGFDSESEFRMLLSDIPVQYRANLPIGGIANGMMRIDRALQSMNPVVSVKGGQRPLQIFVENAVTYVQGSEDVSRLEGLLVKVETGGPRPAPMAAPLAVGPLIEAEPVAFEAEPVAYGVAMRAAMPDLGALNAQDLEHEASIAGFDVTLPIAYLRGGLAAARSVFKIVVQCHRDGAKEFGPGDTPILSTGTCWMIGQGLAVTNDHVFNARQKGEPPADDADYLLQVNTAEVIPDFHDPRSEPDGVGVPPDALLARNRDLDFAIFKVPDSLADRAPLPLRSHAVRKRPQRALGTRVNLLQHPSGGIMKLGFRNNFVVQGDNDILTYLTDTAKGSSGAPVLDDTWSVAALHAGSNSIGDVEIDLQGVRVKRHNFGVPIPRIMAHLEQADAALHARIVAAASG